MKTKDFKACAYFAICNYGGVEIMLDARGEKVIYSYFGKVAQRWQSIKFTASGRAYFCINGHRYHLDEFLRIDL